MKPPKAFAPNAPEITIPHILLFLELTNSLSANVANAANAAGLQH